MIAVDTSVVIPALASWHPDHDAARGIATKSLIPAHARLESYSVLTRLPPPHRLAPEVARQLLDSWFPTSATVVPTSSLCQKIVAQCQEAGVVGGAVYDALVALTASEAEVALVTRDVRASTTYRLVGAAFDLM